MLSIRSNIPERRSRGMSHGITILRNIHLSVFEEDFGCKYEYLTCNLDFQDWCINSSCIFWCFILTLVLSSSKSTHLFHQCLCNTIFQMYLINKASSKCCSHLPVIICFWISYKYYSNLSPAWEFSGRWGTSRCPAPPTWGKGEDRTSDLATPA